MLPRDPYDDVDPADYALPKGVPALQADPLRTRRYFLLFGCGCLAIGVGAGWTFGLYSSRENQAPVISTRKEWARRRAIGPLQELIAASLTFLVVIQQEGGDDTLWRGVERLVDVVLDSAPEEHRALRDRLCDWLPSLTPPPSTVEKLEQLQRSGQRPRRGR